MKSWFLMLSVVCLMGVAQAQEGAVDWKIELTTFRPIGDLRSRLAEACGKVTGPAGQVGKAKVDLKVDYNSKAPGHYVVNLTPEGRFCSVVTTYYGTVEAKVISEASTYIGVSSLLRFSDM